MCPRIRIQDLMTHVTRIYYQTLPMTGAHLHGKTLADSEAIPLVSFLFTRFAF